MALPAWVSEGKHVRVMIQADDKWQPIRLVAGRIPLGPPGEAWAVFRAFVPQVVNPGRSAHAAGEGAHSG